MWDICQPSSLAYKDIKALNHIAQLLNTSPATPLFKKIMELMIDWLDFDNRKSRTQTVTKEALVLGVYDSKLMEAVDDVLRLRTQVR